MKTEAQWIIVAGALVANLGACASRSGVGPNSAPHQASLVASPDSSSGAAKQVGISDAVGRLRFLFVSSHENGTQRRISEIVRRKLGSAGINLVLEPSSAHDATLEVRVRASRASGCAAGDCPANGVQVELAVIHDQQALDWFATAATSEDDAPGLELAITGLVGTLAASPRLGYLIDDVKDLADRQHLEVLAHPGTESGYDDGTREALAWNPSALRRCRNARSAEGCDDLVLYLTGFPGGAHAEVAKATLTAARARLGGPPLAPEATTLSVTSNTRTRGVSDLSAE
jgi:hypothetical protein